MRKALLFSTSTVHPGGYMEYAVPEVRRFLGAHRSILFVPYARPSGMSYDRYTEQFRDRLATAGYRVDGIHEADDPAHAVRAAESIFVGGGNTFVLLRAMYETGILEMLRARVAEGLPYIGSSAGSNVAGLSIGTTNDMPIVWPPSFEALGLVPFNINPHYLDPDPDSTHMGETRETRIDEFHAFNPQPVVGLREGSWLLIDGTSVKLQGTNGARVFRRRQQPEEVEAGACLDSLLQE